MEKTWKCEYCGQKNSYWKDLSCRKCGAPQPEELPEPRKEPAPWGKPRELERPTGGAVVTALFGLLVVWFAAWLILSGSLPFVAPTVPLPEGHLVIRPIWHSEDRVPDDLYRLAAPAILIDPNDRFDKRIFEIIGAEGPGEYNPKGIPDWGNRLMAWGDEARPYVWFQPRWSGELLGSSWGEMTYLEGDRDLFKRWFEEADLIIVEET